jgi:hypothetical protein
MDPLSESYSFQSPFAYAANNPIANIDFMGMSPLGVGGNIKYTINGISVSPDFFDIMAESHYDSKWEEKEEGEEGRKLRRAIRKGERKAKKEGIKHLVFEEVLIVGSPPVKEYTFTLYGETYTIIGTKNDASEYAIEIVKGNMDAKTNRERLHDVFVGDETSEEMPYDGYFKGIGAGGTGIMPHEGFFHTYEFLEWVENNPEEAKKMLQEHYNFIKSVAEKKK